MKPKVKSANKQKQSFTWFVSGDIDGFFGLMVDNLIQLLVLTALCSLVCGFSVEFIYQVVLPGVAISLLVGNLFYSWQAMKLAKKEGRNDVTALPYGINTVSLFAFIFFILMPVYQKTGDFKMAWKVGLLASLLSGLIEFFGSFIAESIRKITPRAALLSALAGIAITFISMDFLFKTFQYPLVAFVPFGLILIQYFGKIQFPFKIPGGLLAILAGTVLAWSSNLMNSEAVSQSFSFTGLYLPGFYFSEIVEAFSLINLSEYIAVILAMGLFNVIGSLQNIESAEAAGDSYNTRDSLLMNGVGTIVGALFGSPFPTTIYIGHPGWKALGARTGYSILNGAFITVICFAGLMATMKALVPVEAGMAIVLWIGIIIGSQAFEATSHKHAPAVIVGLLPALAGWAVLIIQSTFNYTRGQLTGILSKEGLAGKYSILLSDVPLHLPIFPYQLGGMLALSQGFLLVSMIWASLIVFIIDKNFKKAALWAFAGSFLSAVGMIHSYTLRGNDILNNFSFHIIDWFSSEFTIAYIIFGGMFLIAHFSLRGNKRSER